MTYGISRENGKRLVLGLSLLGASQAASARADCADDLVQQVFAIHAADPSPETKVTMHAWLCEGASDAFLSEWAGLPTSTNDLDAWNALLNAIDEDTEISGTPVSGGAARVAQFRSANCASPSPDFLIHSLGRFVSAADFEAWHACDAAATRAANAISPYYDLGLSCAGRELPNGRLSFSVRGFNAEEAGVTTPLRNLAFTYDNLIPVQDYSGVQIASNGIGTFEFDVDDDLSNASIAMVGNAGSVGGGTSFFCSLDLNLDSPTGTSFSTPYGLRHEVECAFEYPRRGPTVCPAGALREQCVDGWWEDTTFCIPDRLPLNVTTGVEPGASGSVLLPDESPCNGTCTWIADKLSTVRLRAFPGTGTKVTWTGPCAVQGNDCLVTMNEASSVTAFFGNLAKLTVNAGGNASGSVTMPSGASCHSGSSCEEFVEPGQPITLQASAGGLTRISWTGCTPNADQTRCTMQATEATVNVTFTEQVVLTAHRQGNGTGTITMPSGAQCSAATCTEAVDRGIPATLQANPNGLMRFTWSGCTESADPTRCTLQPTTNATVSVIFTEQVVVSVNKQGNGTGTIQMPSGVQCSAATCTEAIDKGTSVTLQANPNGRMRFTWSGCTPSADQTRCTLQPTTSATVNVTFTEQVLVTAQKQGNGAGTITMPSGEQCSAATCTEAVDKGISATLQANPNGLMRLTWSGCTPSADLTRCTLQPTTDATVSLTFTEQVIVTTQRHGNGTGSITMPSGVQCSTAICTEAVDRGSSVTLQANPIGAMRFNWTGCTESADKTRCTLQANTAATVGVTFTQLVVVTASKQGSGPGKIRMPSGAECTQAACTEYVDKGATVNLVALPDVDSKVTWTSGCSSVSGTTCTVVANLTTIATAIFTRLPLLTVNLVNGNGTGSVTMPGGESCPKGSICAVFVDPDVSLELRANPTGSTRVTWGPGCTPSADSLRCTLQPSTASRTINVTLTGLANITAKYAGNGVGDIEMPSGGYCSAPSCTETYEKGTTVQLLATPDGGNRVTWSGCSSVSGTRCTVNLTANKTVTATFSRVGNPHLPPHCGPNSPPSCQEP